MIAIPRRSRADVATGRVSPDGRGRDVLARGRGMTGSRRHPLDALLGVDVGGTFTDVVLTDGAGRAASSAKVPTTPHDPVVGVVDGVAVRARRRPAIDPSAVTRFVHGTTLATNVILQRTGGPVALVTTEGFADLLRLGREARVEDDRYDLRFTPAPPPRRRPPHLRGA